jgi:NitT/TauT family transport system permease protein
MSLSLDNANPPLSVAKPAAADRASSRKSGQLFMKNYLPYILAGSIFGVFLLLWEFVFSSRFFPAPSAILAYLSSAIKSGDLQSATLVTMRRLLVGYLIGLVLGIPLGMITARFKVAHLTIGVTALGLQTLPSVCWAPLAIVWFGQTETAMLFIAIMGTIWAVILATDHGIRQIPPLYREAAETMGSRGLHLWLRVLVPASLPHIVSGTKQGWAFAWRSLMAAEIYISVITATGLGLVLHNGREISARDQVLGIMFVIIVIGFAADKLLFSPWEAFLRRRWGLSKS